MDKKNTVAVIFGGKSPEHEVSVITGLQVLNNIDKNKYDVVPVYIAKDGKWFVSDLFFDVEVFKSLDAIPYRAQEVIFNRLSSGAYLVGQKKQFLVPLYKKQIDVFFPCFHGGLGESGGFQALFEIVDTAYVGSGILGSTTGMDKIVMKEIFKSSGIATAPYVWFFRKEWESNTEAIMNNLESQLGYPMFVKPANAGSSVGVSKALDRKELKDAVDIAAAFDRKVVVEKAIEGAKEINVSVIGNSGDMLDVSECEEVFTSAKFLSYEEKYTGEGGKSKGMASAKREIPAKISSEMSNKVKDTAKKVFSSLDCFGLARVDFLIRETTGEIFVIEINTIPGSMSFYLWEASQLPFKNMITKLIELALQRHSEGQKNITSFASNILQNFSPSLKTPKL